MKNKAAASLSKLRWNKTTAKERSEIMGEVSRQGWLTRTTENMGRPRDPNRCPCGEMTAARAKARNHKCR